MSDLVSAFSVLSVLLLGMAALLCALFDEVLDPDKLSDTAHILLIFVRALDAHLINLVFGLSPITVVAVLTVLLT